MKYLYLKLVERFDPGLTLLITIHFFGAIGLISPWRGYFIIFTPVTLIISGVILFSRQFPLNRNFLFFCLFCFIGGFTAELIGVNYGLIFGDYSYGPTLGYQINGVPLMIGINWLILIYSIGISTLMLKVPIWSKVLLGAAMATALDLVLEPVAIEYNFWSWENGTIPVSNYIGWFVVSAIMLTGFHLLKIKSESKVPFYFYQIQFLFFLILYLL